MTPIHVHQLSPDRTSLVGVSLVADASILASEPAFVTDGKTKLEVPLRFYSGDLNLIRTELHRLVDEAVDALDAQQK